ncbi:MAG: hypothetical protein ACKO6Q_06130 [Bacteroidota bacterium]
MRFLFILPLLGLLSACSDAKPKKKYISAPSLIEQQIRQVDTSLYAIKRFTTTDTLLTDTAFVHRDDFRKEVAAFLQIPDLSDPTRANAFSEETRFDELLNRAIIAYTAIDPEKEPFSSIELFIEPNPAAGDPVRTILATRRQGDRNGFEQEQLIWQMDKSCTRILTSRKPGSAEQIKTFKWSWNE